MVKHKDSVSFVQLKPIVSENILSKFLLKNIYIVAAMLDPRFKGRLVTKFDVGQDQFDQARVYLKMRMLDKRGHDQQAAHAAPAAHPKKKPRHNVIEAIEASKYSSDDSDSSEQESEDADVVANAATAANIEAELAVYLAYKITEQDKIILEKQGLLFWWQSKSAKNDGWPLIALVACDILCEPASSAKSECNFSDAGNTVTKKRNQLQPDKLDDLMFLRSTLMSLP